MEEAARADAPRRAVVRMNGERSYDYLILAAGATDSYFGHDERGRDAGELNTAADAGSKTRVPSVAPCSGRQWVATVLRGGPLPVFRSK